MSNEEILVLGATGKTGRRVVAHLQQRGQRVRAPSRSGATRFEWSDEGTWVPALDGVRAAYVVDSEGTDAAEQLAAFSEVAVGRGARDIAAVAAAALTEDGHAGQTYELSGPRLLTFGAAVEEIARATGRDIAYVPVSETDYAARAAERGMPAGVVEVLTLLSGWIRAGRNAHLSDGVQRALRREPRDFSDYVNAAAAAGAWKA